MIRNRSTKHTHKRVSARSLRLTHLHGHMQTPGTCMPHVPSYELIVSPRHCFPSRTEYQTLDSLAHRELHSNTSTRDEHHRTSKLPANREKGVSVTELLLLGERLERKRRRDSKRRYRKVKYDSLDKDIKQLRRVIEQLKQRQCPNHAPVSKKHSVWSAAVEYFHFFRYGLPAKTAEQSSREYFIRTIVAPDVLINDQRGVDEMMQSWRYITLWFQDIQLNLKSLKKSGGNGLIVIAVISASITEETLSNVFPHSSRESTDNLSQLALKLLNQQLVMNGSVRFEWDYGRVTSIQNEFDMLTPMLNLVGALRDVLTLFEKASISHYFQWRSLNLEEKHGKNEARDEEYTLGKEGTLPTPWLSGIKPTISYTSWFDILVVEAKMKPQDPALNTECPKGAELIRLD
ncbi:unnamed protein product [Phytophthora lilii]|uniref:Unnamed protein product n=1 Tax=Phytophthora lilii TaxID=2077276 RepID=A0A9W6TP36_9STRA|nr:unnamed protein product [Phytophthora lilii]